MASKAVPTIKMWNGWKTIKAFETEPGSLLPDAYRKFFKEWKFMTPTAVHYIPKEGKWERNEFTGQVTPIQNISIPLKYPMEYSKGLWGGEGIIKGFQKRNPLKRRVPHFWIPVLKRSVVYSEVLDKYMSAIVTERTLRLIHEHYGFDHYLLKTPACDLKSLLAFKLKRMILQDLSNKCPAYASDPKTQDEVFSRYKKYLDAYTPEEIDWYGYTFRQACAKYAKEQEALNTPKPLKHLYRAQLIEKLKMADIKETGGDDLSPEIKQLSNETSWLQKINPFGKKHET